MKKLIFVMAAFVAVSFMSCGSKTTCTTDSDSTVANNDSVVVDSAAVDTDSVFVDTLVVK